MTAALLATTSPGHVVSITSPLWLTQLHKFALKDPFAGLSSRDPATRAAWKRRPTMRTGQDGYSTGHGGDDSARAAVWRKLSELLDDLVSRGFYPFSSDQSGSGAAPLGSYDTWRNEEDDDPTKDSDACTKLYRDNKQRQVCAISI